LCGAGPEDECFADCQGVSDFGDTSAYVDQPIEEYGPRPMGESLSILAAAVHLLPYGNLVGVRGMGAPDRQDYSPEEYVGRLADWMAEYQPILRAELDELQRQSVARISLEMERDMVRNYLKGVPV
jgi:hypothetical protein